MSLPKSPLAILILGSLLACAVEGPGTVPATTATSPTREAIAKPQAPDLTSLRGTLSAETIRQINAFRCEMTETQASLTQSVSSYLASRDEEPYRTIQSRIDHLTILTLCAKGMTRQRADALMEAVPREKVLHYGWDRVILANDTEGWIFDMAPNPAGKPTR